MRILFVGHNADLYGASRSLLRLTGRLVREGHACAVALPVDGPLAGALRGAGVLVEFVPDMALLERKTLATWAGRFALPAAMLRSRASLRALMARVKPDVVHSNVSVILAAGWAARSAGIPHVQHVREFYTEFGALWRPYGAWLLRQADRVVCVSHAVAGQFADSKKTVVLHNGFPVGEFPPVEPARAAAFRARHGIPAQAPLAGVVGRIKLLRKGQETFIEAAARLRDRLPDARFALVGSPFPGNEAHETELRNRTHAAGLGDRVIFCGEESDVAAAYAALDVVVLASGTPEPFGGVVIEAMAHGRAVIGTAIGGTSEQIVDGTTGLLVPPGDAEAMAGALERLLMEPSTRAAMGAAGRARYLAEFEFEPFFRRMLSVYEDVLKT